MLPYKVKLRFQNEEHLLYWRNLLITTTQAYNDIVQMIYDSKIKISLTEVHNLVYHKMREKYPSLPSKSIIKAYKDAMSNLRSCKGKTCPKRLNPSMWLDKDLCSGLNTTGINLPSKERNHRLRVEFVTYPKFNEMASLYPMKYPQLSMNDGELYMSIPFDVPSKPVTEETYLGVDLGIRRIYTTSDGFSYKGAKFNALRRKIRYQKRQLQSKGTKNAKRKLRKIRSKERNLTKEHVHQICNQLLKTNKNVIVMEDLTKIKQSTSKTKDGHKRKKHNNRMAQVPFYMIRNVLTYKATLIGKRVETVSPHFTSQIDCMTGKRDGQRNGCRYYSTSGIVYDADWNAAINIMNRKHSSPHTVPKDGTLRFEDRLQSTSRMRCIINLKLLGLQPSGS